MKQSPTVSRLLQKTHEVFSILEQLKKSLEFKNKAAFTVTFYHNSDRKLIGTKWSDQYGYDENLDNFMFSYEYEITSRGIHFHSFTEHEVGTPTWQSKRYWTSGYQKDCSLISVPNMGPLDYKGTMYIFHQEQIREALSALPAWAILCGNA